jgi:hypothetical protein
METREKIRIENWHFSMVGRPYQAPELHEAVIIGTDERGVLVRVLCRKVLHRDGEELVTSTKIITLGEPNPEYEKEFPNARERILAGFRSTAVWISVEDRLPTPWVDVLVVDKHGRRQISYFKSPPSSPKRWKCDECVTHWMYLPDLPGVQA